MSRVIHPFGRWCQSPSFHQSAITAGLFSLTLAGLGLAGCSSEEPAPAANQAQANAAPSGAAPAAGGAMPGPGGMSGPPAGMSGPPGGMSGPPGMAPPGGAPNGASAVAGATPTNSAAGYPMPPGNATAVAGATPMPTNSGGGYPLPPGGAPGVAGATPMPTNSGGGYPLPPGGAPGVAGATPMPTNSGALTPMPPGAAANSGALNSGAANPMPQGGVAGAPMPPGGQVAGAGAGAPGSGFAGPAGAAGTPQNPQSPAGTAEFSAESVVIQALKGDASALAEFISPKCKGVLGDIRDGKASEKQIEELRKTLTGVKGVGAKTDNGVKVLTLRNADNSTVTFRVKKEGEDYKVIEMSVKAGVAKKGR